MQETHQGFLARSIPARRRHSLRSRLYSAKKKRHAIACLFFLAEWVGFEPTVPLPVHLISSQGRYNHFDTTPYELALVLYQQARAKSRGFLRKSGECFLGHGKSEEKLRVSAAKEAGTSGELFVEKCPKFPLQIPIFGAIVGRRRECAARILKLGA